MNTKQIWQALTSNTKTEPYFDGVFAIDELRKIKKKKLCDGLRWFKLKDVKMSKR